jgi:hypothetical protein
MKRTAHLRIRSTESLFSLRDSPQLFRSLPKLHRIDYFAHNATELRTAKTSNNDVLAARESDNRAPIWVPAITALKRLFRGSCNSNTSIMIA